MINVEVHAGYIQLNGTQKRIYYYLATSQRDPAKDPLVVWVNGERRNTSPDPLIIDSRHHLQTVFGPYSRDRQSSARV